MKSASLKKTSKIITSILTEDVPSVLKIVTLLDLLIVAPITPQIVLSVLLVILVRRVIVSFNNEKSDSKNNQ